LIRVAFAPFSLDGVDIDISLGIVVVRAAEADDDIDKLLFRAGRAL
jgi:hypothetical protein